MKWWDRLVVWRMESQERRWRQSACPHPLDAHESHLIEMSTDRVWTCTLCGKVLGFAVGVWRRRYRSADYPVLQDDTDKDS